MDELISESTASRRFNLYLLSAFAAAALLLAAIGIYGVVAYSVGQRTQEIGVRMALGAARSDVLRMVLGPGMMLTLIGATLGIGGALALTRLMSAMLFGVGATDPLTFAITAIVLVLAAGLATYIPARRAAKVDPWLRCGTSEDWLCTEYYKTPAFRCASLARTWIRMHGCVCAGHGNCCQRSHIRLCGCGVDQATALR